MISIENLSVEFGGFTLLNDISFVLNKNDRTALVGKNGAGKSTLLKILAGIQRPSQEGFPIRRDLHRISAATNEVERHAHGKRRSRIGI